MAYSVCPHDYFHNPPSFARYYHGKAKLGRYYPIPNFAIILTALGVSPAVGGIPYSGRLR
jgi:hypothetical protein